jgi:uncharacterized protein (TIGR02646 family)
LRSTVVPAVLLDEGNSERELLLLAYFESEAPNISIKPSIYAHETVKTQLVKDQHGKCCFCESKVEHISFGDVEHFRPKKGFVNSEGEQLIAPGYFWLAYDWNNLLFCCEICNRRNKKNLFPLFVPDDRMYMGVETGVVELPVFIDPASENPEDYIAFRGDVIFSKNDNLRGLETIKALDLNREALRSRRQEWLIALRALSFVSTSSEASSELRAQAYEVLNRAITAAGEFTLAARTAIADNFKWAKQI